MAAAVLFVGFVLTLAGVALVAIGLPAWVFFAGLSILGLFALAYLVWTWILGER